MLVEGSKIQHFGPFFEGVTLYAKAEVANKQSEKGLFPTFVAKQMDCGYACRLLLDAFDEQTRQITGGMQCVGGCNCGGAWELSFSNSSKFIFPTLIIIYI